MHLSELPNEVPWKFSVSKTNFRLVERIGFVDGLTFFGTSTVSILADYREDFRCYTDMDLAYHNRDIACDTLADYGVGIEPFSNQSFRIFPNPSNEKIFLAFEQEFQEAELFIYDLQGKQVYAQQLLQPKDELAIDVEKLEPGIYVIRLIENGKDMSSTKLIIAE